MNRPIGTEMTEAQNVISGVPMIACPMPPASAPPMTPAMSVVQKAPGKGVRIFLAPREMTSISGEISGIIARAKAPITNRETRRSAAHRRPSRIRA